MQMMKVIHCDCTQKDCHMIFLQPDGPPIYETFDNGSFAEPPALEGFEPWSTFSLLSSTSEVIRQQYSKQQRLLHFLFAVCAESLWRGT